MSCLRQVSLPVVSRRVEAEAQKSAEIDAGIALPETMEPASMTGARPSD
jgi:hypothetical protein